MLKAHPHNLPVWYSAQASRFVRQSPIHCSNAFTSKHCSVSPDCLLLQTGWCCGYSPVLLGKGSTAWGCLHQKPLASRLAMKVTHRIRAYQITWDHLGITMSCNLCKGTVRFSDIFFRIFAVEVDSMSSFGLDSVKPDSSFASRRVEVVRAPWSFTVTWWNRSISCHLMICHICHSMS